MKRRNVAAKGHDSSALSEMSTSVSHTAERPGGERRRLLSRLGGEETRWEEAKGR